MSPPVYKPKPTECVLSASSLSAFAQCPTKFRAQYHEFIRPAEDSEALRKGSNIHAMFEHVGDAPDEDVIRFISERYENVPVSKDAEDWEVERNSLLALFLNYRHQWRADPVTITEAEHPFKIELEPGLVIQGKIDGIGTWQGKDVIIERKSTSTSLDDKDYWNRLRMDMQISIYTLYLAEQGKRLNTLYDVIRKPTIRQKQKESVEEFYQRLNADIAERPAHYYARREVPRTDTDLAAFRVQLKRIASAVRFYIKEGAWWHNQSACRNPYPCAYFPICYGVGMEAAIKELPNGFVRLTRNGK